MNSSVQLSSQVGHTSDKHTLTRADEVLELLQPIVQRLGRFLAEADTELDIHQNRGPASSSDTCLVSDTSLDPGKLKEVIRPSLSLPDEGLGQSGLMKTLEDILAHSVNTTAPGFLDKLYASPLPPGIAAELILAVLNTNLHVYQVSPVLSLIEQYVTKALANKFGFEGSRAGGISVQGGSASNLTSIVVARNSLFPATKAFGNTAVRSGQLVLFTSVHGHYSIEKAAQALGMGSSNVVSVPVDDEGKMRPVDLEILIEKARAEGKTPFYINATAGSTVLGSFDPFNQIADIARRQGCWLHVDGAWGGSFVFAGRDDLRSSLAGIHRADSIAINPHKMLGVPITCSFLLTRDLRLFEAAMTLRAGYLFHDTDVEDDQEDTVENDETMESKRVKDPDTGGLPETARLYDMRDDSSVWSEPNDLADMTLQCGRRGDSLKFFLSWQYYGTFGYTQRVDRAYALALTLSNLVDQHKDLRLVLDNHSKPQCLQVCFYYTPGGKFVFGRAASPGLLQIPSHKREAASSSAVTISRVIGRHNTIVTSRITKRLIAYGYMIDFAPALEQQEDRGSFFRVVINISTVRETVDRLIASIVETGNAVVLDLERTYSSTR